MRLVDRLAQALLYEGYVLYPYRADTTKNRQRFTIGALCPPDFCREAAGADASSLRTECLVESPSDAVLLVRVKFLHLSAREISERIEQSPDVAGACEYFEAVDVLVVDGRAHQAWQEAVEREIVLPRMRLDRLTAQTRRQRFRFEAHCQSEPLVTSKGRTAGRVTRRQLAVEGSIVVSAVPVQEGLYRVGVEVLNETLSEAGSGANREQALLESLVSAHVIMQVKQGKFVSLIDPDNHASAAASCQNLGAWPVLVGEPPERDTMLASPIILYDYPEIAPESPGDLCDGTEIDEILMLRIMTLTDDEKQAMRALDARSREILDCTDHLPEEQFKKMHGAIRGLRPLRETTNGSA